MRRPAMPSVRAAAAAAAATCETENKGGRETNKPMVCFQKGTRIPPMPRFVSVAALALGNLLPAGEHDMLA